MSTAGEKGMTALTVVMSIVTIVLLASPSGPLGSRVAAWQKVRADKRQAALSWSAMDSVAQRSHPGSGRVSVFEFADYECPYCRVGHLATEAWEAKHPEAQIGFIHFPLRIHAAAEGAARSALCADEAQKGPAMHRLLMTTDAWRADTNWYGLAAQAGVLDLDRFRVCLHSERITTRLARSAQLATTLGVNGTPTFVSLSSRAFGAQSVEELEKLR